ncbi:hypothetical protein GR212_15890 [Rhizobium lusitanum]|uniref:Uncharacterized protein n=1 Tax=Rhizobium lusitanum TaxID=293958 RepID=A0A6L9U6D8_9HYPH|nr:hypothetical protein [Rhizobium lusitanum]NEI71061.1 hypothetical protein [Rhizobium lusitanum]
MIEIIKSLITRFRWQWVGTVEGQTQLTDENGHPIKAGACKNAYWNLYVRGDGRRAFEEVGNVYRYHASQACRRTKAQIDAWKFGGPLPPLLYKPTPPAPRGKLVLFPGGKKDH